MSARKLAMSARKYARVAGLALVLAALVGGVVTTGAAHGSVDASAVAYSTLDYVWV